MDPIWLYTNRLDSSSARLKIWRCVDVGDGVSAGVGVGVGIYVHE